MRAGVLLTYLLLIASTLPAQIIESLALSHDTVTVGDPIGVIYKLQLPPGEAAVAGVDYGTMMDSLQSLSLVDQRASPAEADWEGDFMSVSDNTLLRSQLGLRQAANGSRTYADTFVLTVYETGSYTLHLPTLLIDSTQNMMERISGTSPSFVVGVTGDFVSFVEAHKDSMSMDKIKANLRPNVENIFTKKSISDYWPLLTILGLVLLAVLFYLGYRYRQNQSSTPLLPKPTAPAYYLTMKKLSKLRQEKLWLKDKDKEYQSQLTHTIREYLEKRYQIKALESTTGELKKALGDKVTTDQNSELINILQIADLVKFAKAQTTDDLNEQFLDRADDFVRDTQDQMEGWNEQDYLEQMTAYQNQFKK